MGIFQEKPLPRWMVILFLTTAFLILYQPWNAAEAEFSKTEGFYAVQSQELSSFFAPVTAHHVVIGNADVLYPMLCKALSRLPVIGERELPFRLIPILFTLLTAVVVYFAAGGRKRGNAGIVSSTMFFSCALLLEQSMTGSPLTLTVFLLFSAQMVWFYFGIRKGDWNLSWILTSLLLALAYFSGGFQALLFFVFPMLFLRRPLSVRSKFEHSGFWIALGILGAAIASRLLPLLFLPRDVSVHFLNSINLSFGEYLRDLALFPWHAFVRSLPWALIGWIPFCVALQNLDETPVYSMYLRTLFLSSLALAWVLPDAAPQALCYLAAPWAVMTGINYDLALRRYAFKLRKTLLVLQYAAFLPVAAMILALFLPQKFLDLFMSLHNTLLFRESAYFGIKTAIIAGAVLLAVLFLIFRRESTPVWLTLTALSCVCAMFYWQILQPYHAQAKSRQILGMHLQNALPPDNGKAPVVYKHQIIGLYSELYYSGFDVHSIRDLAELPEKEERVYLLNTAFPAFPDRAWTRLLPVDFQYRNSRLCLWRGDLKHDTGGN